MDQHHHYYHYYDYYRCYRLPDYDYSRIDRIQNDDVVAVVVGHHMDVVDADDDGYPTKLDSYGRHYHYHWLLQWP